MTQKIIVYTPTEYALYESGTLAYIIFAVLSAIVYLLIAEAASKSIGFKAQKQYWNWVFGLGLPCVFGIAWCMNWLVVHL